MRLRRAAAVLALLGAHPALAQMPALRGDQLIVDGKPFLILGGELGNSSASSRAWLAPAWPRLQAMHLNTVLAPVSWELIEPIEGKFDFTTVDGLIADARAHGMRLGLLWFGAWKNSMSTYVPAWVKRDPRRFPRALAEDGTPQEILSAFAPATRDADARAFAALMAHLRAVNGERHTVILVQVENEIGFLPDAREHGAAADAAFARYRGSEEAFTAEAYARYTEAVAAAGKRAYPLPIYVNGAQGRPGRKPGDYPAGGPLVHLLAPWKRAAPSIDFLAPDIYFPNFGEIARGYALPGNPLLVPEANNAGDPRAAANAFLVFGGLKGIGFSPFSIDSIDASGAARMTALYDLLGGMAPAILAAQASGRIAGVAPPVTFDGAVDERPQPVTLGGYAFTVSFVDPWTVRTAQTPAEHGGMLLWQGGDEVLIAGTGITVTVAPAAGGGKVGLESVEEGRFEDGRFVPLRRLNGDQTHQGRHVRLPPDAIGVQRVRLYRY